MSGPRWWKCGRIGEINNCAHGDVYADRCKVSLGNLVSLLQACADRRYVEADAMRAELCGWIGGVCADSRIGTYSGCREVHERCIRIKKSHVMRVEDSGHI